MKRKLNIPLLIYNFTIEFSGNILEKDDFHTLFPKCHEVLVKTLPTNLINCKSRAVQYSLYCIGNGHKNNAFIHCDLRVMAGRSDETLRKLIHELMEVLKIHFSASLKILSLEITLEINELQKNYLKHRSD